MLCIRYAEDIVLLAKSGRAAERLLESGTKYLEEMLKLKMNREKSRTVSVFAIRNSKYLGFGFGKNGNGIYIRVHGKRYGRALRINCVGSLPGAGAGALSDPWRG